MLQLLPFKLTSWRGIENSLARLGADAALYVGSPDGTTIHAMNASAPLAIGSAFKRYVLAALAEAIEQGNAGWQVAPSGRMSRTKVDRSQRVEPDLVPRAPTT